MKMKWKRYISLCLLIVLMSAAVFTSDKIKVQASEVDTSELEEKKQEPYKLTFEDNDFLYICIGYGEQKSGGYSIAVLELYETQNAVYVHTNLLGPTEEEAKKQAPSWPHIVVKTQKKDKTVVFD